MENNKNMDMEPKMPESEFEVDGCFDDTDDLTDFDFDELDEDDLEDDEDFEGIMGFES